MTTIQEQVAMDWKTAMKAKDPRKGAYSLIKSELKNAAMDHREAGSDSVELNDELALGVLTKMAKQRRESIKEYNAGGRPELAEKEQAELECISSYLPKALTSTEIAEIVKEVIASVGATSMKEMGKVMGPVMAKTKGRADGGAVQAAVKELLS